MEHSKQGTEKKPKKIEQDLTYTVEGDFTSAPSIEINVCIPDEDMNNRYNFRSYDISTPNKNAILLHLRQSNSNNRLRWESPNNYSIYPFGSTDESPSATGFDITKDYALIFVFHEDSITSDDINRMHENVDGLYNYTDGFDDDRCIIYWPSSSSKMIKSEKKKDEKTAPRIVGMTIIRKRGTV